MPENAFAAGAALRTPRGDTQHSPTPPTCPRTTPRSQLSVPGCCAALNNSHSMRSRFFAERVINVSNCLPPFVDYSTLATFKRSIDGIDFTSSLKCDTD